MFQLRRTRSKEYTSKQQPTTTPMKPLHNETRTAHCVVVDNNEHYRVVYIAYLKEHNFHFQSRHCHSVIIYHPGKQVNEFFRSLTPRCNKKMHYDHSLRSAARWFMMGSSSSNEKFILLAFRQCSGRIFNDAFLLSAQRKRVHV